MNDTLITIILWCGALIGLGIVLPVLFYLAILLLTATAAIFIGAYEYISSLFTRK